MSFTSEIATAAFSLFSMELCDRGVLPSNDTFLNNQMSVNLCPRNWIWVKRSPFDCFSPSSVWQKDFCPTWVFTSATFIRCWNLKAWGFFVINFKRERGRNSLICHRVYVITSIPFFLIKHLYFCKLYSKII